MNGRQGSEFESVHRFAFESKAAPDLARERLRDLRSTIVALQAEHPEILGATVYGSTVKGEATPQSDLDGVLWLDADRIAPDMIAVSQSFGAVRLDRNLAEWYKWRVIDRHTQLQETAQRPHRLEGSQWKDFSVNPISQEIIDAVLPVVLLSVDNVSAYRGKDAAVRTRMFSATRILSSLFHLGVADRKLRPLRTHVIDRLQEHGQSGEQVWAAIREELLWYEEGRRKADVYFPSSLRQAEMTFWTGKDLK